MARRLRQPPAGSPERAIARAPDDSRVSGRSARRVSTVASAAASAAAASAQQRDEPARVVERAVDLGEGAGHDHRAAGGVAAAQLAERRGVDAQRVGAQRAVGEARRRLAQRAVERAAGLSTRPPSPLERATIRPRGRPPARTACAGEPALERARRGQLVGRGGVELRDVGRAPHERVVERALQLALEELGTAMTSSATASTIAAAAASATRARRRQSRSSRKPTPRTVWISGGSPSLRRR